MAKTRNASFWLGVIEIPGQKPEQFCSRQRPDVEDFLDQTDLVASDIPGYASHLFKLKFHRGRIYSEKATRSPSRDSGVLTHAQTPARPASEAPAGKSDPS